MSYTYLQEQGEESSAECFSDIPAYVLSKLNLTAAKSCCNASETESCQGSQYGMTSAHLTASLGGGGLTLFAEDSHAKTSAQPDGAQESKANEADYGEKWPASFVKYDPDSRSWKTRQCSLLAGLDVFSETWPKWGMMRDGECFRRHNAALNTYAKGYFYLPTPTAHNAKEGNYPAEKDRRTPLLATHAGGRINPEWTEWLMGWPIKWTDSKPLETAKFQAWLRSHGAYYQEPTNAR